MPRKGRPNCFMCMPASGIQYHNQLWLFRRRTPTAVLSADNLEPPCLLLGFIWFPWSEWSESDAELVANTRGGNQVATAITKERRHTRDKVSADVGAASCRFPCLRPNESLSSKALEFRLLMTGVCTAVPRFTSLQWLRMLMM